MRAGSRVAGTGSARSGGRPLASGSPVVHRWWRGAALAVALLAILAAPPARAADRCQAVASAPDARQQQWLRALVREVALQERVEPAALEALGLTETGLRPAVGLACELGPFQVMRSWARVFRLDSPALLWDPRINAIAAARIYQAAWLRWEPRFARLGRNRALRAAGWRAAALDRESFAALAYNWGKAPFLFARTGNLRVVAIPASSARYAVRFSRALREARQRARAGSGTPRAPPPSSRAGARAAS